MFCVKARERPFVPVAVRFRPIRPAAHGKTLFQRAEQRVVAHFSVCGERLVIRIPFGAESPERQAQRGKPLFVQLTVIHPPRIAPEVQMLVFLRLQQPFVGEHAEIDQILVSRKRGAGLIGAVSEPRRPDGEHLPYADAGVPQKIDPLIGRAPQGTDPARRRQRVNGHQDPRFPLMKHESLLPHRKSCLFPDTCAYVTRVRPPGCAPRWRACPCRSDGAPRRDAHTAPAPCSHSDSRDRRARRISRPLFPLLF